MKEGGSVMRILQKYGWEIWLAWTRMVAVGKQRKDKNRNKRNRGQN